jgi:hypothetical protein
MKKSLLIVIAILFAFVLIAIQHQIKREIVLETHDRIVGQAKESLEHSEAARDRAIEARRQREAAMPVGNQAAN